MKWRFSSSELVESDIAFQRNVDGWLLSALEKLPVSWQCLLRNMPGVFPLDVWASFERLGVPSSHLILSPATPEPANTADLLPYSHIPEHPSDFEWRFNQEAIDAIFKTVEDFVPNSGNISLACLGCPTIFVAGIQQRQDWVWTLHDRRGNEYQKYSDRGEVISCDLAKALRESHTQDVAIVDPPWYNSITKCFLLNALRLLKPGGIVLLSAPGAGTRPSAIDDTNEILEWCLHHGMMILSFNPGALPYRTPYFEYNALRSAGFSAIVPSWRRGNLIVLKASNELSIDFEESTVALPVPTYQTNTYLVGKSKIVVISNDSANRGHENDNPITQVWREEIIPSVSTRFPVRNRANIITSGNRFLRCANTDTVNGYLQIMSRSKNASSGKDLGTISGSLRVIMDREETEIDTFNIHYK